MFQELSTEGPNDELPNPEEPDIVMLAIQAADIETHPGPSRAHLKASLRKEEARSRQLRRLLQNQYSKMSRHQKYHQQTVAGFRSEVEILNRRNLALLAEKKTLEETIEKTKLEMASQSQTTQSAVLDANFFEVLISSRDKLVEQLLNEKKQIFQNLVAIKAQLERLTRNQ